MKAIAKAEEHDKVRVASAEMIKTPLWLIEQILLKHETAVIEVMKDMYDELQALKSAVKKVHAAKGQYNTKIAVFQLYLLCDLPNDGTAK
jgi:hypothetical protein